MSFSHIVTILAAFVGVNTAYSIQNNVNPVNQIRTRNIMNSVNDLYSGSYTSGATTATSTTQDFSNVGVTGNEKSKKYEADSTIIVQGGSLCTWSYTSPKVEQIQVVLCSEGRPFDADIELWQGPDNTPCKVRVYAENGRLRPFNAVLETPREQNTIAIRNIGQLEFPFAAHVYHKHVDVPSLDTNAASSTIQGGALRTYPFDGFVESVEVLLKTNGRPLNARIELLQGPNNNKQVMELYTEDGNDRPFFCILETPGSGNVVRVVNTGPIEFPMRASVLPHSIKSRFDSSAVIGGNASW